MRQDNPTARDVARKELRDVLASTEALLAALGDQGGDAVNDLRERLTSTIDDVRKELGNSLLDSARDKIERARDTAATVNEFVRERPWSAVAIAAGVGVIVGLIMRD
jgi:ElaB/YqjD/DUF883 family membrane-anchored ribosome-binding protein